MTFDWNTFQTNYQAASDETKNLIDTDVIANCIQYQLGYKTVDESQQRAVKTLCAFSILEVISSEEAVTEMQTLGIPNANEVFTTLQTCINSAKFIQSNTVVPPPTKTESDTTVEKDLASEIEEAEAAFNAIPKMKTMVQDTEQTSTYSSSQEALLRESRPKQP